MPKDYLGSLTSGSIASSFGVPSSFADFTGVELGPPEGMDALKALLAQKGPGGQGPRGPGRRQNPDGNGSPKSGEAGHLLNFAERQIGNPYSFGSTSPGPTDCSGLIYGALTKIWGHPPPARTAQAMQHWTKPVSKRHLDPGDLVFMHYPNSRGIGPGQASHVGIYVGHGQMINAGSGGVQREAVDWSAYIGGGAIPHL